ncbi:hypothetical protein E9840_04110 [Tissierella creatinini]|nr:hypothetical protein E9840_04110 [Tissierella creatinini]TJX66364.1 hypothetical protein E8P77_08220 [Soehngenia saccharolytica]
MQNFSIETVHKLESQVIKKLYDFIDKIIGIDDILDEIEEENPLFMDDRNRSGLKLWLGFDYRDKDGRTYIDKFLEEEGDSLLAFEKRLLIDVRNSFITLCEITGFEDEYIHVLDVLQNKEFKVLEPYINEILKVGEFILVRIGKVMDYYIFMGDTSYLPASCKPMFMENFLIDYNLKRKMDSELPVWDYLKNHSLELIENYNNSILTSIDLDRLSNPFFFDELDEFGEYLKAKNEASIAGKDIPNLVEFFDHYLIEEGLSLYGFSEFDFKDFFQNAIKDGFICSKESLNSYISTFKRFINFLSYRYDNYKRTYKDILDISENRFQYMAKLNNFRTPFNTNSALEHRITGRLNDKGVELIINFDRYILYIMDKALELTSNQNLKRKYLLEINNYLTDRVALKSRYANQEDYPLIDMFYHIGQRCGITSIEKNKLILTRKGTTFLRLRDEEKFLILFTSIWNRDFFYNMTGIDANILDITMKNFISLTSHLEENKSYEVKYILDRFDFNLDFLLGINEYLKLLGLVRTNFYPTYSWEITKLGKLVFEYLYEKNHNLQSSSLVELDMYRDKKH